MLVPVRRQAQLKNEDRDRDRKYRVGEAVETVDGKLVAILKRRHAASIASRHAVD
jgi:hypothetical protein